jgi:uncharacterized cupredoxin-like copper-binding protein
MKLKLAAVAVVVMLAAGGVGALARAQDAPTDEPLPTNIQVVLNDLYFEPAELRVPAGALITIHVVNEGASVHTFDIDELDVQTGDVASGGSIMFQFFTGEPGTYEFYCAIPGHRDAGMVGTLIVEASSASEETAMSEQADETATLETRVADLESRIAQLEQTVESLQSQQPSDQSSTGGSLSGDYSITCRGFLSIGDVEFETRYDFGAKIEVITGAHLASIDANRCSIAPSLGP